MINALIDLYFNPEKSMKKAVGKESIVRGIFNFSIIPVVIAFIFGLLIGILTLVFGGSPTPTEMIMPIIGFPIGAFILVLIGSLLVNLFFWFANKLVKNPKNFTKLYYTLSVGFLSVMIVLVVPAIIYIIGMMLTQIAAVGLAVNPAMSSFAFLGLALSAIGLVLLIPLALLGHYTCWLVLKEATGLENKKLVKALLITTIITAVAGFIILVLLGAILIQVLGLGAVPAV